jgi:hypothetical protein
VLVRVVSTKVDVGWGAYILGDASMSSLRYVRELDGMVHHPYFPQGSLGGHDVMHLGHGLMCLPAVSINREWRLLLLVEGPISIGIMMLLRY